MKEELSRKIKLEISERLKRIREQKGMSKYEFAKFIGVSNQYYSTLERGDNCLSVGKIIDFCNITGLSADYILLGKISNIDEEMSEFLSNYNSKDVERIFSIIKSIMDMIKDKSNT